MLRQKEGMAALEAQGLNHKDIEYLIREEGWGYLESVDPNQINDPALRKLVIEYVRALGKITTYLDEAFEY